MIKIRYEEATGRVNLISNGDREMPVKGCKYMTLASRPWFNDQFENLYIIDGKVIAIDDRSHPPLHRIIG